MIKQYLAIKGEHPDAILFYRMGDFYEMFFEDAETASRVLEITLTSRNKNDESPVPMCGVPYHAASALLEEADRRALRQLNGVLSILHRKIDVIFEEVVIESGCSGGGCSCRAIASGPRSSLSALFLVLLLAVGGLPYSLNRRR